MLYSLETVISELNALVTDNVIENYAIGGANGLSFYGEPMVTEDVDVFVIFKGSELLLDPSPVFDHLKAKGYEFDGEYIIIGEWPVRLLPPPKPLEQEAIEKANTMQDGDICARVMTLEHLAAIALQTGRAKDHTRLIGVRTEGSLDTVEFEAILSRHGLTEKWQTHLQKFPESEL